MPRFRKSLGQHHLRHRHLCAPAVDFLRPRGHLVVEIGPGGGVLTSALLAAGARLVTWELDEAWAFALRRKADCAQARIVIGDGLTIPWSRLPDGTRVAGNLPYGIATALIVDLLTHGAGVDRAAFLVQAEVADRLVAAPGSRAYGYLTVATALFAEVEVLATVAPGSFRPPPRVAGAFVGLVRRPCPVARDQIGSFLETVAAAFRARRKTLRNALTLAWGRERAVEALRSAGVDGRRRAETLGLADLLELHRASRRGNRGALPEAPEKSL